MALIRGGMGSFPCPICLVPKDELGKPDADYERRTGAKAQEIYDHAMSEKLLKNREARLREWSLRPVQVSST